MSKAKGKQKQQRMGRRVLAAVCVMLVLGTLPGLAGDRGPKNNDSSSNDNNSTGAGASRDVDTRDLKGITKKHRYWWAMAGGAALGAGIGALLPPGSGKSATKGMLLGGSLTSFFYLAGHKEAADGYRPLAYIATNTVLGTGIGWSVCNCGTGAWTGALIGGGFTAIVQAVRPRHHRTLTKYTGADQPPVNPPPQQQQPPQQPPQQQQQQQTTPPPQPQQTTPPPQSQSPNPPQASSSPQTTAPPDQPPDAPQPKDDR